MSNYLNLTGYIKQLNIIVIFRPISGVWVPHKAGKCLGVYEWKAIPKPGKGKPLKQAILHYPVRPLMLTFAGLSKK